MGMPRSGATDGLPSMAVQDFTPTYRPGITEKFPPQVIPFLDYQMGRRDSTLRTRLPLENPGHADFQWRCSVKNSFLHMEISDNSDEDFEPDASSWDSSQRSSSVPSRLGHISHGLVSAARRPDVT